MAAAHICFQLLLSVVWITGSTGQSDDKVNDVVCKINDKPIKLLAPHAVKGFRLKGADLDKVGNHKLCLSPGEGTEITSLINCSSPQIQLWNLEVYKDSPGKYWFRLVLNSSNEQCLTLSSASVMTLKPCDLEEIGQWWAFIYQGPRDNKPSKIKPGHNLLIGLKMCKCLQANIDGNLFFTTCPVTVSSKEELQRSSSPVRFWIIERTKSVPCPKLNRTYDALRDKKGAESNLEFEQEQTKLDDSKEGKWEQYSLITTTDVPARVPME